MHIHLHCHCNREGEIMHLLKENRELLLIIKSQNNHIMSVADDLKALAAQAKVSLDNIKLDVAKLANGIPEGGLTAAEAQELKAQLTDLAGEAADIDALTPNDAPTEPQA